MYATANMVRARACGKLVLGDKANPQTTFHLNEGHVTDMCEIGGDLQSQRDVELFNINFGPNSCASVG